MRTFKQITQRDRVMISRLKAYGFSISEIARRLGKNKSTISREVRRNTNEYFGLDDDYWTAESAQRVKDFRTWKANQRRRRKKIATRAWVFAKLNLGWSPEQISGRSKIDGPESLSHECIYQMVIADKKAGGAAYKLLKRFNKRKSRFSVRAYPPSERPSIRSRPKAVDQLKRVGDLEADLIQGYKADGYVLTVLDRKTQFVVLRKLASKHKGVVTKAFMQALKKFGQTHTLTLDNGKEFYGYLELENKLGIQVYFSDPYCSTQRARVENMNGLVRYYLPKKSSFKSLNQLRLNKIEKRLNNRPRKTLKFLTPVEFHNKYLRQTSVAFVS